MPSLKFWKNEKYFSRCDFPCFIPFSLKCKDIRFWINKPPVDSKSHNFMPSPGHYGEDNNIPGRWLQSPKLENIRRWDNASPIGGMVGDGIIWMSIPPQQEVFQRAVLSHHMANMAMFLKSYKKRGRWGACCSWMAFVLCSMFQTCVFSLGRTTHEFQSILYIHAYIDT